ALAASLVRPGDTVIDVGAHVGIYTLLFSASVGPTGNVIAFEPSPDNVAYLRKHLALNNAGNVTIVNAAVAAQSGRARFAFGADSSTGHVSNEGTLEVVTIRLDDYITEARCRPSLIKIDVEGAEVEVLEGLADTLRTAAPALLVATHSPALKATCTERLAAHG